MSVRRDVPRPRASLSLRSIGAFVLLTAWALSTGCNALNLPAVESPAPVANTEGVFRAGATIVDLTPPPGIATWGHGPDSPESRGHRGRIRCRVVYLEDARGERVVLMPCDFAAMAVNLQRGVAEEVDARVGIGVDRLVMSATHAHGGPGNYFAAYNYHRNLTSNPKGYDRALVRWMVTRLARGIEHAYDHARPARIAWATAFINGGGGDERAIGVNRSIVAHCRNDHPMGANPSTCESRAPNANAEVEGRLDLLRIDALEPDGPKPLALFASFPVHGTVVPHSSEFFQGDLWGFAARYLEARLRDDGTFVAALANGPEGDVRPNYEEQSWDEARRLGHLLGARIAAVHADATAWEQAPTIATAYRDLPLRNAPVDRPNDELHTCPSPVFGRPAPGGSEEGRTTGIVHFVSRPEGTTSRHPHGCHKPARHVPFANVQAPDYPDVAPLSIVRIGRARVVSYPWEMTTTAGIRLRDRLSQTLGDDSPIALVGLANEYIQYITTPEEFAAQHYEGASNFYGPNTLPVLIDTLARLTVELRDAEANGTHVVHAQEIHIRRTKPKRHFRDDRHSYEPRINVDGSGATQFEGHDAFQVRFRAGDPNSVGPNAAIIARVEVRDATGVFVPLRDAVGTAIDDAHEDVVFEMEKRRCRRDRSRYRVVWVPGAGTPAGDYRIVVLGPAHLHPSPSMTFRGRP